MRPTKPRVRLARGFALAGVGAFACFAMLDPLQTEPSHRFTLVR